MQIDVFVSHAHDDKPLIKPIVDALLRDGFSLFVDKPAEMGFSIEEIRYWESKFDVSLLYYMEGGKEDWRAAIKKNAKKALVVLACISPNLSGSRSVLTDEWGIGSHEDKLFACSVSDSIRNEDVKKFLKESGGLINPQGHQVNSLDENALRRLVLKRGDGPWPNSETLDNPEDRRALAAYVQLRDKMKEHIGVLASDRPSDADAITAACREFFVDHASKLTTRARTAFADALRKFISDELATLLLDERYKDLADRIAASRVIQFMKALSAALAALAKSPTATARDFAGLKDISCALAPMIALNAGSHVDKVARKIGGGGLSYIELDVSARTMAEIIVAAAEKRTVRMRAQSGYVADPIGELALPLGGENGPEDFEGVEAASDIIAEIIQRGSVLGPQDNLNEQSKHDAKDIVSEIWRKVRERLPNTSDNSIRRKLRFGREIDDPSYYILVRMPASKNSQRYLVTVLQRVREALPDLDIILLVIGPDGAFEDQEDLLLGFWRTLSAREGGW